MSFWSTKIKPTRVVVLFLLLVLMLIVVAMGGGYIYDRNVYWYRYELSCGMTMDEVANILGEAETKLGDDENAEWYYEIAGNRDKFILCFKEGKLNGVKAGKDSFDLIAQAPQQIVSVRVDEIGTRVQIIGRLGKTMATMMTVRGVWRAPPEKLEKPDIRLRFHVTEVDGRQLPKPVVFLDGLVHIDGNRTLQAEAGAIWELRAFETGTFLNIKARHWKEFYGSPVSPPDWDQHSLFVSELTGVIKSIRREGDDTVGRTIP